MYGFDNMLNVATVRSSSDHLTATNFLPFVVTKNGVTVTEDIIGLIKHLFYHYVNWTTRPSQKSKKGYVEDEEDSLQLGAQLAGEGSRPKSQAGQNDLDLPTKMSLGFKLGTAAANLAVAILLLLFSNSRTVLGQGEAAAALLNNGSVVVANASSIPTVNVSATVWDMVTLHCPSSTNDVGEDDDPEVIWVTPDQQMLLSSPSALLSSNLRCNSSDDLKSTSSSPSPWQPQLSVHDASDPRLWLSPNGSLTVEDFGWSDRGSYRCVVLAQTGDDDVGDADNGVGQVDVTLDVDYRKHIYYFSLLYGAVSATGFLLLTLLCRLVYWLLET